MTSKQKKQAELIKSRDYCNELFNSSKYNSKNVQNMINNNKFLTTGSDENTDNIKPNE